MKLLSKFFLAVLLLTAASVSWAACPEGQKQTYKGCEAACPPGAKPDFKGGCVSVKSEKIEIINHPETYWPEDNPSREGPTKDAYDLTERPKLYVQGPFEPCVFENSICTTPGYNKVQEKFKGIEKYTVRRPGVGLFDFSISSDISPTCPTQVSDLRDFPSWRKGFLGAAPVFAGADIFQDVAWAHKEGTYGTDVTEWLAKTLTGARNETTRQQAADVIKTVLLDGARQKGWSLLYFSGPAWNILESGRVYLNWSLQIGYDAALNYGLFRALPALLNAYAFVKQTAPENDSDVMEIRAWIERIIWLSEQGPGNGVSSDGQLSPSLPNHHTIEKGLVYTLWGAIDGDDEYFQAGIRHFTALLRMARRDGSLSTEVMPTRCDTCPEGGWASLAQNNQDVSAMVAIAYIAHLQGYDLGEIQFRSNLHQVVTYAIAETFSPHLAIETAKVSKFDQRYLTVPRVLRRDNMSWVWLYNSIYPNQEIVEKNANSLFSHSFAFDLGIDSMLCSGLIVKEIEVKESEQQSVAEDLGREATVEVFSTGIYVENTTWAANKLGRIEIRDGTNNLVKFERVRVLVAADESHDLLYPDGLMLAIINRDFPSIRESSDCGRKHLDKSTRLPAEWRFEFLGSNSVIPNNCRFRMLTKGEQDKLWLLVNNIDRIVEIADTPVPKGTRPNYWLKLAAKIRAAAPDSFYR